MLKILLRTSTSIDNQNQLGRSPLFYAVMNDLWEFVELLLKNGAQADLQGESTLKKINFVWLFAKIVIA